MPNTSLTDAFHSHDDVRLWIKNTALSLGFADCGFVSPTHPIFKEQLAALKNWLACGYEGQLAFLHEHHDLRANPEKLVTGTKTIISVRMDYLSVAPRPRHIDDNDHPNQAIIARYARGRDYHKTMRGQLKKLATAIETMLPHWTHLDINADTPFVFRPFSDSAPIFERPLAEVAGLGWTGKHTLLINRHAGSFFVLGELFISLDLADDAPAQKNHCGSCTACIDICPTRAIVPVPPEHTQDGKPRYSINAAACISYLTIEHKGVIDETYRKAMGNRIFGCDDCQLICPWNRYAKLAAVPDFLPRHGLDDITLLEVWSWSESDFLEKTEGSPLRRTGHLNLLRNTAIALGNALACADKEKKPALKTALTARLGENTLLDEHIIWALNQA
ncbi:MAG: tRNA epoxyqueuosine(34) reductase QueG [Moraxella sp.]|nr:tRNA epoxyqueuosine(34) reductase QueG [Moraxella sp.]